MNIKHTEYLKEVENALLGLSKKSNKEKAEKLKHYLGTQLDVLGLVTKEQIEISKNTYSFCTLDCDKRFLIFDHIYQHSTTHEGKNQAFIFLDKHHKNISLQLQLKILPSWVIHVDNWAHSDNLSKFLSKLIEDEKTQKEMLAISETWNSSENLWERRQSLVSLFYYARTKKDYVAFKTIKQYIKPLLKDKEYYVQKAVGWTLRESYNVYPKDTFLFIEKYIKHISSTAFTTCLEKMNEEQKSLLKFKRKNK